MERKSYRSRSRQRGSFAGEQVWPVHRAADLATRQPAGHQPSRPPTSCSGHERYGRAPSVPHLPTGDAEPLRLRTPPAFDRDFTAWASKVRAFSDSCMSASALASRTSAVPPDREHVIAGRHDPGAFQEAPASEIPSCAAVKPPAWRWMFPRMDTHRRDREDSRSSGRAV